MPSIAFVVAFWVVMLLVAIPVALRTRHPDQKPVAAVAIFFFVFTLVAFVIYVVLTTLLVVLGLQTLLGTPHGVAVFLVLVFAPAFVAARWQIRKAPRKPPPLE